MVLMQWLNGLIRRAPRPNSRRRPLRPEKPETEHRASCLREFDAPR
jgi:hypothetical protein